MDHQKGSGMFLEAGGSCLEQDIVTETHLAGSGSYMSKG